MFAFLPDPTNQHLSWTYWTKLLQSSPYKRSCVLATKICNLFMFHAKVLHQTKHSFFVNHSIVIQSTVNRFQLLKTSSKKGPRRCKLETTNKQRKYFQQQKKYQLCIKILALHTTNTIPFLNSRQQLLWCGRAIILLLALNEMLQEIISCNILWRLARAWVWQAFHATLCNNQILWGL